MKFKDFVRLHPLFFIVIFFSAAVCGVTLYLREYNIACVEIVLGIVLSLITLAIERRNFQDLKKSVKILNSFIYSDSENRVSSIPLPFIILGDRGSILWYNNLFEKEVLGDRKLSEREVRCFIDPQKIEDGLKEGRADVDYGERRYTVYIQDIPGMEKDEYILCFVDDTYFKNIDEKYKKSRPVVAIASIDAMDEVSSSMTQNQFSSLLSDVERIINSWFSRYPCIFRKLGDGRFLAILEYGAFERMKRDGFRALDEVRNKRPEPGYNGLTMSVGIAAGFDLVTCESAARKALDMAKGRGGDQVVINENDVYNFVGGVATGVESRNQVQSRIVGGSFEELIKHSDLVIIMGHKNSDLDSVGATIGIYEAVRNIGVKAKIFIDEKNTMATPLIKYYKEKKGDDAFIKESKALDLCDEGTLVVVTDVMRSKLCDSEALAEKASKKVVIDHHRTSVDYMSDALIFFHEPNSSSASEMVVELIRYMPSKPKISPEAAEALLAGIYLDTKNFTLKTGVRTFEAAAYLRDTGANTITVRKLFSASAEENTAVNSIVNGAEIKGNYAFAKVEKGVPDPRLVASKASDSLLNIENVDASFVIYEDDFGGVSISARSYGRVNVQVVMEKLGGGGHHTMAAAQLGSISYEDAKLKLVEALEEYARSN